MIHVCFIRNEKVHYYRCRFLSEALFLAAAARFAGARSVQVIA